MIDSYRVRIPRMGLVALTVSACALVAGCFEEEGPSTAEIEPPWSSSPPPSGAADEPADDAPIGSDAGTSPAEPIDACADGGCAPPPAPTGCAARPEAAFCDDFDDPDALTPNKTKWDFLEPTAQPVLTLSKDRAVSAPSSLLTRVVDKDTPGAKFAKTVTKSGFTEVTWEYDVFFASIGTEDGFFLDDFQFSDAAGADSFGFRLVMFAEAGELKELKVEHNPFAIGKDYVIEPALPAGAVALGKWHHFEQTVKFVFASEGGGPDEDRVSYSLSIDGAARFEKDYAGPSREQAAFARIAGMPLVFNKERSTGLAIHWDNHVLEMK